MARREKKSESLDVRLPHSVKQRFMAETSERGETASEAVRRFIETYLDTPRAGETETPNRSFLAMAKPHLTKITSMVAATAAGAFALTFIPIASADEATFKLFDKNDDGFLTPGEIAPNDEGLIQVLDLDGSASVSADEFRVPFESIEISERVITGTSGETSRRMIVTRVDFKLEDETTHLSISRTSGDLPDNPSQADRDEMMDSLLQKIEGHRDVHGVMPTPPVPPKPTQ
ncbi:MAG: hypothetical protein AAFQ22_05640 [Pseudomonadota bacterium]